jgi:DNA-nicking Smr family endonuclease
MGERDDNARSLFRQAVHGTRLMKQKEQPKLVTPKPRPVAQRRKQDEEDVMASLLSDEYSPEAVEVGEELIFCRPGVQTRVFRKFRRGDYAIEAELDLHSLKVPEAREQITKFLRECRAKDKRCVCIIHGKGFGSLAKVPVLKQKVNDWLRQKNEVLAFCSARPNDGGSGAVYVLLKRL